MSRDWQRWERNLTAAGERRLKTYLSGNVWTGPVLSDDDHLIAIAFALAKWQGRDASRLQVLAGPTEATNAAIHYVWWTWAARTRHANIHGLRPAQQLEWTRKEFGVQTLINAVYDVALLLA